MTSLKPNVVAYCSDAGMILPTLLAADNAAGAPGAEAYDVVVYADRGCLPQGFADWHAAREHPYAVVEADFAATFPPEVRMNRGYPVGVAFKFLLPGLLGDRYRRLLYLDSDTEIRGSIAPLFGLDLGGHPFAGVDCLPVTFPDETGAMRCVRPAMLRRQAGLPVEAEYSSYVNVGALLIDIAAWEAKATGREALSFLDANPKACRHNEEDALNAVASGRFCRLSPRWNYMPQFYPDGMHDVDPTVVHYSGPAKPWFPDTWTGDPAAVERYRRLIDATPWPGPQAPGARQSTSQARRIGVALEGALRSLRRTARRSWTGAPPPKPRDDAACLRAWLATTPFADVAQGITPPFRVQA